MMCGDGGFSRQITEQVALYRPRIPVALGDFNGGQAFDDKSRPPWASQGVFVSRVFGVIRASPGTHR